MPAELKKPYSLNDIAKRPYAVTISLLIGLLLISVGYNVVVNTKADMRVDKIREEMDQEKKDRIRMYEDMIFYRDKAVELETERDNADSLVRQKTQPLVNKIMKHVKK